MEFELYFNIFYILIIPIITIILASLFYSIYLFLTTSQKNIIKGGISHYIFTSIKKDFYFKKNEIFQFNILLFIYWIFIAVLSFLIAKYYSLIRTEIAMELFIVIGISFVPLLFSGNLYTNKDLYTTSKKLFSIIGDYYIPLVISLLSIFLIFSVSSPQPNNFGYESVINSQINNSIQILGFQVISLYLFINPLACLSYFFSMIGIFKAFRNNEYRKNTINQKVASKLLRNMVFLSLIGTFILLFFGGGQLFNNDLYNLGFLLGLSLICIIVIALIDYDRPKLFIERKLGNLINIPGILSLISLIYSVILIFLL